MSVQGFWGLQVVPGKTYTQIVSAPFRIAMASLTADIKSEKRTCVSVKVDKRDFILCTLIPNKIEQQSLDLNFVEGEEVTFFVQGDNVVHLTGNYVFSDDDDEIESYSGSDMEEDDEDDDEDIDELPGTLTDKQMLKLLSSEGDLDLEDDDEEEEDDDEVDDDEDEEEDEDEDEEEEEEEEEAEEAVPATKKRPAEVAVKEQPSKKAKKEEEQKKKVEEQKKAEEQKKKAEAQKKKAEEQKKKEEAKKKEDAKKKAEEQKKKAEEQKKKEEPKKVTKLPNGLIIEDIKTGDGVSCKSGQRVGMRYIGKLTNGKVFDKNVSGKPFFFVLGRGEVIKGWDIGVAGMKVGGERKLTIPAPLAYGKRGAPPDIPKNATLVFDIKLVSMK